MRCCGREAHDPRRLAAAPQFSAHPLAALAPSLRLDRGASSMALDLDGNDVLPVCPAVAIANAAKRFAKVLAGIDLTVPEARVWTLFAATVGCADNAVAIGATEGAVFMDILGTLFRQGLPANDNGNLLLVPAVSVLDGSLGQLALATEHFGIGTIGLSIYTADMDAIAAGRMLDLDGSNPGPLYGRHMTGTLDYAGLRPTDPWHVNFWGGAIPEVTGRWLLDRIDESYALAFRNLLGPDKVANYPDMLTASGLKFA